MKQTAKDLRRALALLERDGWRQNFFGPPERGIREPRCAGGACMAVAPTLARYAFACHALRRALPPSAPRYTGTYYRSFVRCFDTIAAYNDHPGRRFSTIQRWFKRAIAAEEGL